MANHEYYSEKHRECHSEVIDSKGNSLFHLIASGERMSLNSIKAIDLLKKYNVNPTTRNKDGQTPLMILRRRKDERYRLIEEIVKSFTSCPANKKKRKKNKKGKNNRNNKNSSPDLSQEDDSSTTPGRPSTSLQCSSQPKGVKEKKREQKYCEGANAHPESELDIVRNRITETINNLEDEVVDGGLEKKKGNQREADPSPSHLRKLEDQEPPVASSIGLTFTRDRSPEDKRPLPSNGVDVLDLPNDGEMVEEDIDFDNLSWEVECTTDVWKILSGSQLSLAMKKSIVKAVQLLACGHMQGHLPIYLEGLPDESNVFLFETKLARGTSILWERAVAFSPRCSNNTELLGWKKEERVSRIYSEIIRIWDIVFDHATAIRKIENIVRCHKRGSSCIVKKRLQGFEFKSSPSLGSNLISIPKLYTYKGDRSLSDDSSCTLSSEVSTMFIPPGSPEDTEYHILKFYTFSNSLVNAVLEDRGKTNVDFPFRVSELEHAVVNLKPNPMSSLLLLGRSGTGKTTCCLYRLWSNFQSYWERHTLDEPVIPKCQQFIPKKTDGNMVNGRGSWREDEDCWAEDASDDVETAFSPKSSFDLFANSKAAANEKEVALCSKSTCGKDLDTTIEEPGYEHLHQVFITKNAVLCSEVQRNFHNLSRGCVATRHHSEYQRLSSVNKFDQLQEQAWPLFVCSRDWLLILDASLPQPAFFTRNDIGELLLSVKGWGKEDNHLQKIPEENSDDEDYSKDEVDLHPNDNVQEVNDSKAPGRVDPRLEVTYQVFKNELWPTMTKKRKVEYHPTLVWTEIRSFIKGSVEALHSVDGYITVEEYQALGRKRAPSFSADREIVYELFLAYQRIKRWKGMFDEADLVYHIYHRLLGTVPEWSIHEIYVDETQDFTQAELSVIILCCRNPNKLFFTGDTAQSIMRGVAFRFNDLKSLFYYMKESYRAVGQESEVHVPDRVYQLTHNYRSHAGILNLASSVIDLLLHFFPESFDRMERDQGLFHGPKPVLLESCSFGDLAVILRGHKRKTSPIEFGAHQVVLVASDEVRDSLPEELSLALVMTIYEAKGLEFDDVLLYNFFKNSQVSKTQNTNLKFSLVRTNHFGRVAVQSRRKAAICTSEKNDYLLTECEINSTKSDVSADGGTKSTTDDFTIFMILC